MQKKKPKHFLIPENLLDALYCYAELACLPKNLLIRGIIASGVNADTIKKHKDDIIGSSPYFRSTIERKKKCLAFDVETSKNLKEATRELGCSKGFLASFLITQFLENEFMRLRVNDYGFIASSDENMPEVVAVLHEKYAAR